MTDNKITNVINREDAFNYIFSVKCGTQESLKTKITLELFNQFCLVGYIKQGMDGEWNERWEITDFGESQISAYLEFAKKKKELDGILGKH